MDATSVSVVVRGIATATLVIDHVVLAHVPGGFSVKRTMPPR